MSNYSFEQFVVAVEEGLKCFLPSDVQFERRDTVKINHCYNALIVKGDELACPSIDLDRLYESYKNGKSMNTILEDIKNILDCDKPDISPEEFTSYAQIKHRLFIRVCDAERNEEVLSSVPHMLIDGLAITYHISVSIGEDGVGSAMISNDILKGYGVSLETLHADAVENSRKILPPTVQPIEYMMEKMFGALSEPEIPKCFAEQVENLKEDITLLVLTNDSATNGAAVIFYPDVLDMISEKTGMAFYILPSSTHEVLLYPDNGSMSIEDLEMMVKDVNQTEVDPKDQLSDTVFYYSRQKGFCQAV